MLGEEDALSPTERSDGLCEIANVLCSHVLTEIFGQHAEFKLKPPRPLDSATSAESGQAAQARARVSIDGGYVELSLAMEEAA
jgi:hypothetical protein